MSRGRNRGPKYVMIQPARRSLYQRVDYTGSQTIHAAAHVARKAGGFVANVLLYTFAAGVVLGIIFVSYAVNGSREPGDEPPSPFIQHHWATEAPPSPWIQSDRRNYQASPSPFIYNR